MARLDAAAAKSANASIWSDDATHDAAFQHPAGGFFALFLASFYDKQKHVLGEYFEDDWSKIEPVSVEPGHQAEWVWLLKGFERITGCPMGRHRAELLASALRYRDEATGCLIDEGDADGPEGTAGAAGLRPKSPRRGSRRPRRVTREPQNKRAPHCRASIGIIFVIPSRAAGTINSIATAARWSRPSRRLRFIMCSARL
jgi:N-acylglucosamine 2-epimerase (GlcNAc 2-epimerase)